jgi:hypothetical protein
MSTSVRELIRILKTFPQDAQVLDPDGKEITVVSHYPKTNEVIINKE